MRCVVTMVSNVSDSSDAWPGMLLDAHMLQHSVKRHTKRAARMHTRVHAQKNERAHSKTVRTHTGTVRKKWHVSRRKQLQLPAREERLPVDSLQNAAGQPRYQPISNVEAECRKLG